MICFYNKTPAPKGKKPAVTHFGAQRQGGGGALANPPPPPSPLKTPTPPPPHRSKEALYIPQIPNPLHCISKCAHEVLIIIRGRD